MPMPLFYFSAKDISFSRPRLFLFKNWIYLLNLAVNLHRHAVEAEISGVNSVNGEIPSVILLIEAPSGKEIYVCISQPTGFSVCLHNYFNSLCVIIGAGVIRS